MVVLLSPLVASDEQEEGKDEAEGQLSQVEEVDHEADGDEAAGEDPHEDAAGSHRLLHCH